jgi:2-polyprenyl-3-methyl-5-hydroxy-6-metoxy-1,4-benzoquinol methylase
MNPSSTKLGSNHFTDPRPDSIGPGYYDNERPEIFRLVEENARVILDVGCGKGRLGANLKQAVLGRKVFGIEHNDRIAAEAKKVLDRVLIGDLQTMNIPFDLERFDCIIFADILEHLVDPDAALRRLKPHLKPHGKVICSIPNMRHYTAILKLLYRGWEYNGWGLFDRTHLRFFSLHTMKKLLADQGFQIERIEPRIVASRKMKFLNTLCFGKLEEFIAWQYLIKARNSPVR